MRIVFFFLLISLVSCLKHKIDSDSIYFDLIGVWESVGLEDAITIEIRDNGIMFLSSEIERGSKIKILTVQSEPNLNSPFLNGIISTFCPKNNVGCLRIDSNITLDTISTTQITVVDNGIYSTPENSYDRVFYTKIK